MTLSERDKKHLWHPLTQHKTSPDTLAIAKAKGVKLWDEHGKEYIDGISSWYTAMYGHCNSFITDKVAKQMQQLDQVVFSGFTHEPAIKLSEALIKILPANQEKLFFSDNGSTATEIGIKMAYLESKLSMAAENKNIFSFIKVTLQMLINSKGSQYSVRDILWIVRKLAHSLFETKR